MDKLDSGSLDITKMNIEKLKQLFPSIVTEGKIDFDALKMVLGDEIDNSKEKYQFTWCGKNDAIKIAQSPSTSTLRPCKDESKIWEATENIYIEGDNLEALKQLQKTYYGKIKMIYIDPPYNTGNDFVYNDSFSASIENYKEKTNQSVSSNAKTDGRYHTNWLNMLYPRLILARNLLAEDGVIFISIDDNELFGLIAMCNSIFGEENKVETIVWKNKYGAAAQTVGFISLHEYILCYSKKPIQNITSELDEEGQKSYNKMDEKYNTRGGYMTQPLMTTSLGDRPNLMYSIEYNGDVIHPRKQWVWSKDRLLQAIENNEVVFNKQSDGNYSVRVKKYLYDEDGNIRRGKPLSIQNGPFTQEGTKEIRELFDGKSIFDFAKPSKLIEYLLSLQINNDESKDYIVLDFFSGSGTTAQALFNLNYRTNGNRKFILVQLPESCDKNTMAYKEGYANICEIGKERIRRAGEQIKKEWMEKNNPEGLFHEENKEFPFDIGFKVFKLDSSNIKPWDSEYQYDENNIFDLADVFKEDRTKEDILYEIMLKYGIFDMPAIEIEVNGKTMFRVGKRYMIVCLEDNITKEDIQEICELAPRTVVFKESGFADDNDKINAVYNLEKAGVEDIKCI